MSTEPGQLHVEGLAKQSAVTCPGCREASRKAQSPNHWLTQARLRQGLSLTELARRSGIPKGTLSNIETGRLGTFAQKQKLRALLGLPTDQDDLFGGST